MNDPLFRVAPCPVMSTGRVCGRTDERPTVLDPILGVICADHRPQFAPKPTPVPQEVQS